MKYIRTLLCMMAVIASMLSCTKDDIIPEKEEPEEKPAETIQDTPESILIAVSGVYSVEKVTESQNDYLFEFSSPSPITLNKEYPEGISKVTLKKSEVKEYAEDGKTISVTFKDGKSASLKYSAWLSVKFLSSSVSFDEACTPGEIAFEIVENDSDSISVRVDGCGKYANYETALDNDKKNGRITFLLMSDKYFSAEAEVIVSNGKRAVSQKVSLSRVDFKFIDGLLSREYSFPEYGRYMEFMMHSADTAVHVSVSEECRDWIQAKVLNLNIDDVDRTLVCILLSDNRGDSRRSGKVSVTRTGLDRELPITVSQIGSEMEGSLRKGLESFYTALHGENWLHHDNWCSDHPMFEWYGICASNTTSKVLFGDEGLTYLGTDDVWVLDLAANNMRGTVPDSFWNVCKYFEIIRISSEYLPDSTVPDCVWHENLWKLDLSTSFMNVPLSSAVGNAKRLNYLDLSLCRVKGGLPEEITTLPELKEINMCESSLTGTLPQGLGNLKNLVNLNLNCNMELGGTLPDSFYSLENLRNFNIGMTKVGGRLSSEITKLTRLQDFEINGCEFEGTIPEEFGKLGNLIGYDFQGNYFDAIPQFVRYIAYNSKKNGQYAGSGDWVGGAGFPLGIPYFQRKKTDGRPENYVVTVPDVFEFSEILVDGKPLKRSGYYVDYTKCFQHTFPIWAHIRYDLQNWERSCSLTMKCPQYPYADDLQYPAYQYYYDGKDWRHPDLEYPAREYLKVGNEWVHDPTCPWDAEYKQ